MVESGYLRAADSYRWRHEHLEFHHDAVPPHTDGLIEPFSDHSQITSEDENIFIALGINYLEPIRVASTHGNICYLNLAHASYHESFVVRLSTALASFDGDFAGQRGVPMVKDHDIPHPILEPKYAAIRVPILA